MYKNILIPVALDHNHDIQEALKIAQLLREEGGKITLLSVVEAVSGYVASYLPKDQTENSRKEIMARLKLDAGDIENVETQVIIGHPGSAIVDEAKAHDVDLIIITSHKPGLQDFFLGSTAARVVRYSQCPVHVLR